MVISDWIKDEGADQQPGWVQKCSRPVARSRVEDGDAEVTILVNIWVPHFRLES